MLHKLVAVYDRKAECFGKPVATLSHGAAVRSFGDAVNDKSTEYNKHPEDFTMFAVGEYNDTTGELISEKPLELAKALALKTSDHVAS